MSRVTPRASMAAQKPDHRLEVGAAGVPVRIVTPKNSQNRSSVRGPSAATSAGAAAEPPDGEGGGGSRLRRPGPGLEIGDHELDVLGGEPIDGAAEAVAIASRQMAQRRDLSALGGPPEMLEGLLRIDRPAQAVAVEHAEVVQGRPGSALGGGLEAGARQREIHAGESRGPGGVLGPEPPGEGEGPADRGQLVWVRTRVRIHSPGFILRVGPPPAGNAGRDLFGYQPVSEADCRQFDPAKTLGMPAPVDRSLAEPAARQVEPSARNPLAPIDKEAGVIADRRPSSSSCRHRCVRWWRASMPSRTCVSGWASRCGSIRQTAG